MKRSVLALVLLLVGLAAHGQPLVYYQSQATLAWNAVTVDAAGDPFIPTDVVAYEIYIYDAIAHTALNPQTAEYLVLVGTTAATQQLIVFPYRTTWIAGGRTRVTDAGGNVKYSPWAWSNIATDAGPSGPFSYVPLPTLRPPSGLRDAGT